ncbi:MAG: flippase [Patescibacteria group bacterium]
MVAFPVAVNGGRVAKNTTYLTLALIGQKLLSALYFPIIAGLIGPSSAGLYLAALSFINIFAIFIDLGLTPAFIRQTARDEREGKREFNVIMSFKVLSSVVVATTVIITVVILSRAGISHPDISYIRWAAFGMTLDALTATGYGFFRGLQRLEFEAIGTVLHRVVVTIVGLTALQLGAPAIVVIIALVTGSAANFLYASFHLWRQGISWRPSWDWAVLKKLLIIAWPFAVAALFTAIYANSDTVLLQTFKDHRSVGLYGMANKMVIAFQIIPAALVGAIYPAMSSAFVTDRARLQRLIVDSMRYLMVVFIPIMVVIVLLAQPLVLHIYKSLWLDAVWPLRVLAISLPFLFLHYPLGYLLNAANRQTRNTWNVVITVTLNIGLNLLFIREFSYKSVAVISVFSSALLFSLGLYYARKIMPLSGRVLLATLGKTTAAGFILAAVGAGLVSYVNSLWGAVLIAAVLAVLYVVLLFLLRIVRSHDVEALFRRLRRV